MVKGEVLNEDEDDENWNPAGPWLVDTVDVSGTFACDCIGVPDVHVVLMPDCPWFAVAAGNPPVNVDGTFVDDLRIFDKMDPATCWDGNEGTAEAWDCVAMALACTVGLVHEAHVTAVLCGSPVAGAGVMRLWVVVVVMVPALVTAPAVGILNDEAEVVAAVDKTAVGSNGKIQRRTTS